MATALVHSLTSFNWLKCFLLAEEVTIFTVQYNDVLLIRGLELASNS